MARLVPVSTSRIVLGLQGSDPRARTVWPDGLMLTWNRLARMAPIRGARRLVGAEARTREGSLPSRASTRDVNRRAMVLPSGVAVTSSGPSSSGMLLAMASGVAVQIRSRSGSATRKRSGPSGTRYMGVPGQPGGRLGIGQRNEIESRGRSDHDALLRQSGGDARRFGERDSGLKDERIGGPVHNFCCDGPSLASVGVSQGGAGMGERLPQPPLGKHERGGRPVRDFLRGGGLLAGVLFSGAGSVEIFLSLTLGRFRLFAGDQSRPRSAGGPDGLPGTRNDSEHQCHRHRANGGERHFVPASELLKFISCARRTGHNGFVVKVTL